MKKIIYLLITLILISCNSNSQIHLEIVTKKTNKPLKMVFDKFGKDSTYLYLCFPKTIIYDNKTDALHLVERYSVDRHHSGRNLRDYTT